MKRQFAYLRVSTKEQNLDRQIEAVKAYCPAMSNDDIYKDKFTGTTMDRPEYHALKRNIRTGDELIIQSLDRLGRTKRLIKEELQYYKDKGITIRILNIPTTLADVDGNELILDLIQTIMIEVIATFAESEYMERKIRMEQGIAIAKAKGVYKGRKEAPLPDNFYDVYTRWKNKELKATEAMKLLEMPPATFYRKVKCVQSNIDGGVAV